MFELTQSQSPPKQELSRFRSSARIECTTVSVDEHNGDQFRRMILPPRLQLLTTATNPAKHPFMHMVRSYETSPVLYDSIMASVKTPEMAPAAAAIVEVTAASEAVAADPELAIIKVDPGLKPYQPNQSRKLQTKGITP